MYTIIGMLVVALDVDVVVLLAIALHCYCCCCCCIVVADVRVLALVVGLRFALLMGVMACRLRFVIY